MATCWSIEQDKMLNADESTIATIVVPLDDVEPLPASATTTPYALDYSLMTTVFAILLFLWMQ